jgi:hypothetical protein
MEANPQRIEWPQLGPRKTTAHEGISQVRVIQTKSVEAVGIEPSSDHPVSHDSVAITRNGLDAETPLKPSEPGMPDPLGTRVPKLNRGDSLLAPVRRAWGALRVV